TCGYKEVLCPYWQRTENGTIRCVFTDLEVLDDESQDAEESLSLLATHLGSKERANAFPRNWALADEIKVCGINEDKDDPWAYDV
ncbi:MAG TPA: hypothetical protein VFL97_09570, partial [Nitrococcus sp.]|nr:hypothetical protein [Nitrococcus sp.]